MSASVLHSWRPSNARLITLESTANGTPVVTPSWPAKDPGDLLDFMVDLSSLIAGDFTDAIVSVAVNIIPDATGDLTLVNSALDGTAVVLWVQGGQPGTTYGVTLVITTLNGRTITRTLLLPVIALTVTSLTSGSLTTGAGATLTDQNGNVITLGA